MRSSTELIRYAVERMAPSILVSIAIRFPSCSNYRGLCFSKSLPISNGKSASLQRLVGHCWGVYQTYALQDGFDGL